MSTMGFFANPCDHLAVTRLGKVRQLKGSEAKCWIPICYLENLFQTCLLTYLPTYLLASFEAAWRCHIVKTNSAQKRTLTKSYEYLQTFLANSIVIVLKQY